MLQTEGFAVLDHPADLGFRAWAPSLPDLFGQCGKALTSVLVDLDTVLPSETVGVEVIGCDLETLLYNWLSEILYLFDGEKMLCCEFSVINHKRSADGEFLQGELRGEKYSAERHQIKTYVKAVTFHQMKIEHTKQGYEATVYLDI